MCLVKVLIEIELVIYPPMLIYRLNLHINLEVAITNLLGPRIK